MIALPLLRLLAWVLYFLPVPVRLGLGNGLGRLLGAAGFRSKVIAQNLRYAFPDDPERRVRVEREFRAHLGNLVLEILFVFGPMKRFVLRNAEIRGIEHWQRAKDKGRGVIILGSHVGNWEVMAASGGLLGRMDPMIVTKHLKPEWLHRAIEAGRSICGVGGTYEPRTLKDVLRKLRTGGTVGIILDQYSGPPIGVRVPVFGVPVGTSTVIASLARRTGAAVISMVSYRDDRGRFLAEIRPELEVRQGDEPAEDLAFNTARFALELEKDIRAHPGQWLWSHRRFKGDLSPLRAEEWGEGRARR